LSIRRYERLYLLALLFGTASAGLDWPHKAATLAGNPDLAGTAWVLPVSVVGNVVLRLTLWFYTARRASVAAKWFVVTLAALAFLFLLFGLMALIADAAPSIPAAVAGIVSGTLYVAAAAYLFRTDARAWFGEALHEEEEVGI
jgi:hypothetical protein